MNRSLNSFSIHLRLLVIILLAVAVSGAAQARPAHFQSEQNEGDKKEGKEKKEKKEKEKEKDKSEKNEEKEKGGLFGRAKGAVSGSKGADDEKLEMEYSKLLESAQRKYNDPKKDDFRERVDRLYKQKRREHSDFAFQMNTFNSRDDLTTFTGDKLRLEDTIYDNPLVQDYVNRVGHSLVAPDSLHRYAFRVVLNPVPDARALSTGTVYITTGLLSMIDNEAQLAYILGHEISHIEKNHWLQDAMVVAEMEDRARTIEKWAGLAGLAGGVIGGVATKSFTKGVGIGALLTGGTYVVLKFIGDSKTYDWDRAQENEADQEGLRLMFERNYDPREVPKLYARVRALTDREPRLADGFLARSERVSERLGFFSSSLTGMTSKVNMVRGSSNLRRFRSTEAADSEAVSPLEAGKAIGLTEENEKREKDATQRLARMDEVLRDKLDKNEIIGTSAEFESVMADLKRDNGVRAFYFDLFSIALENLREARQIRSNDPYAHYYLGKILQLTARNRAEKAEAMQSFVTAIDLDKRGVLADPWLHRALALLGDKNPSQRQEIVGYLHRYVDIYQQEHSGTLPPNMDAIYAYLKDLGDHQWAARPAMNVSTKNVEPIEVASGTRAPSRPAPEEPAPTIGRKGRPGRP